MVRYKLLSSETLDDGSRLFVVRRTDQPGWFARLFGHRGKTRDLTFVGTGTVWLQWPECTDPGYAIRDFLYRLEQRERYQPMMTIPWLDHPIYAMTVTPRSAADRGAIERFVGRVRAATGSGPMRVEPDASGAVRFRGLRRSESLALLAQARAAGLDGLAHVDLAAPASPRPRRPLEPPMPLFGE